MVDQGQSLNFTSNQDVTWSLASLGTLTNVTKTSVTYNAPAVVNAAAMDHLIATSVKDTKKSVSIEIDLLPPPSITTAALPDGTNATAYSQQVQASGGVGTKTFTVPANTLPAGLTMSASGLITGKPTGSNVTSNFTITVTDQGTPPLMAMKALSIHIAPPPALVITSTSPLPNGTTNVVYNSSGAVAASGGIAPVTFAITGGALPHGLALNANTGLITGTPDTTANNFGVFNFTVTATDTAIPPQTPSKAFTITITPPLLAITNTTLPNGQVGFSYNGTVQAMGGFPPLVFSVSAGTLPNGLALNAANGAITSMPTVANTFNFTIKVQDAAAQMATQAYTVTIAPAISIALTTPPPASLQATLTAIVAATVSNDSGNMGVDWSVTCGSAGACGSFNPVHTASAGNTTFTAPAAVPTGGTVTITATSTADPTKKASGMTTITPPPIIVTFVSTLPPVSLQVSTSATVTAHVANDSMNLGVDWSVTCGSAGACGSFSLAHTASDTGTMFTAPAAVPTGTTVTIKAASTADNTKFVTAVITITTAPPVMIVFTTAPPTSLIVSATAPMSATVTNDPTNAGVNWIVLCGSAGRCGSFSALHTASGANTTYTAPAAVPAGPSVTIRAVSAADNTKFVTANTTITPTPIMIIFMPLLPASVATSSVTTMSSTVSNDPTIAGVDWSVTCGSASCGSFNPTHTASGANTTYTAPAAVPAGGTVTIKAASTADNTKFATGNVTITGGALTCPLTLGGQENLLNGTYAGLFNGWDDTKGMFQATASVTANGAGTITGGVADSNGVGQTPSINQTITNGCYTIGTGGRGKMIWNFGGGGGSVTFSFVMRADGKNGNLIEFDDTTGTTGGRGSGSIRLQDTTLFLASTLNGAFAFGVRGEKSDGTRVGSLGAFSLNGVNTLSGGAVDYSEPNTSFTGLAATGSFTAPDATHGRGTLTITIASVPVIGNLTLHFAYYITRGGSGTLPIIYLQSTDTPDAVGHPLQNGLMAKQSGGPFSAASVTGSVIFALTGFDSSHGITNTIVGLATSAGTGTFTGFGDQEADAAPLVNVAVSGTIVIGANGLGTLQITSPAVLVPTSIVMVAPNTALMLEGTQTGPGKDTQTGILQPQTAGPFTTGSLVGTFIFGSDEPATTATDVEVGTVAITSPGFITITQDSSNTSGLQPNTVMTATYTMAANGRGDITITSGGSGTAVIYLYSANKAVVMRRGGGDIALFNLEQ